MQSVNLSGSPIKRFRALELLQGIPIVRENWALLFCMMFASYIFFFGVVTGSVQPFYVDELFYTRYPMELSQWLLTASDVEFTYVHPSGYSMVLAMVFGLYFSYGIIAGQFSGMQDFLVQFATHRATFIVLARCVSAAFALASLPAVYWLASRLFDRRVAIISVLVTMFCYPIILYAHLAANITMVIFLTIVALCFVYRVWIVGKVKDYVLAGAFIGMGVGTKYYPALLLVPLCLAHVKRVGWSWSKPRVVSVDVHKLFFAMASLSVCAVLFFPLPVFAHEQWRHFLQDTVSYYKGGNVIENALRLLFGNPTYWATTTAEPVSWWSNSLLALGEIGLAWLWFGLVYGLMRFPWKWSQLALPFLILFLYQVLRGGLGLGVRQFYFALPPMWILASASMIDLVDRLIHAPAKRTLAILLVTSLLLVQPIAGAATYIQLASNQTTVEIGRDWLLKNIPRGSVLLVDGSAAPFGETDEWWRPSGDSLRNGFLVNVQRERAAVAAYRVISMKWINARMECEEALSIGNPVFVVTTDFFFSQYWEAGTIAAWGNLNLGRSLPMRQYVRQIQDNTEVLQIIRPKHVDAFGPTISIAKLEEWKTE